MKLFLLRLAIFLLLVLVIAGAWWAGQQLGFAEGQAAATTHCLQQQITTQDGTQKQMAALVQDAQKASLEINSSIARRREADEQTTREIRHALTQTAVQRVECVLPADVMQQLDTARERANAAAASGIAGAVPGAAASGR